MKTTEQKQTFTPGEWHLDGFLILSDEHNPSIIATVGHDQQGLGRGHERSMANVRLIAAAPDAYALLEFVLERIAAGAHNIPLDALFGDDDTSFRSAVVAYFKKVEGES